ncbi:MAG: hypothetical protein IJ802_02800 [Kiritimatiellae bacterium]|nr:hypothetical protein [Kiritimatiellia bacterium]
MNKAVSRRALKYYIFDWDDNILHMPTKIYLERRCSDGGWEKTEVSTSSFALMRKDPTTWRMPAEGGAAAAFRDFKDPADGGENAFLRDTAEAIERVKRGARPGPSFNTLRKTLREGRLFAVVTARGHRAETLEKAVRLFIAEVLTEREREEMMASLRGYRWWLDGCEKFGTDEEELAYYLALCQYHAVTGPDFARMLSQDEAFARDLSCADGARRPEMAKEYAIKGFVEHLFHTLERTGALGHPVSVGFSDDDAGNVHAVSNYIRTCLAERFGAFKFVVYDTSDPALSKGRKIVIANARK